MSTTLDGYLKSDKIINTNSHHHRLPWFFSLSGQIKGKSGCVVCIDGTCYTYLNASKKMVYMRHRRFLIKKHRYRAAMMNKYFDDENEPQIDEPKRTRYGQKVFDMVQGIDIEFGKKKKEEDGTTTRKKRKRDKMEEMLAAFFTPPSLKYRPQTPVSIWPLSPDYPDNYVHGKFMVPLGQLV